MARDHSFDNRKFVIGGIAVGIILIYIVRLFSLQLFSDDYKKSADSNAFRKEIIYPSRGLVTDRKGNLLVYNEPSYNIMVVMQEQWGVDTLDFCQTVGITPEFYKQRMQEIKQRIGYSRHTPQLFMSQIPAEEFSVFKENLYRFNGFSAEKRTIRHYADGMGAHILGDVGEVNEKDILNDPYYRSGDNIGKLGIERSYEQYLRGEKGMRIMLRDVRGRTKGHYMDGKYDIAPIPGRNLTLGLDKDLQALAERLLQGKLGAIVAIEPALKPAVLAHKDQRVLLMATPLAIRTERILALAERFRTDAEITLLPCPGLVEMIETGHVSDEPLREHLRSLFAGLSHKPNAVVLGCTHYPHVRPALQEYFGDDVALYDGGAGTARRMADILRERELLAPPSSKGSVTFRFSAEDPETLALAETLFRK
jgi:cell division protein FtsI/penicillin-binding protein 2